MNGIIENLSGLDDVILHCMHDGSIPGLVLGIVVDGEVACAKGFGYRDLERRLPVTARSRFGIQSCTKAFTAAVAGILVDRGLLEWDRPIREYVPSFRMHDLVAGVQATMRDLLSHRTGMPNGGHDWLRVATQVARQEYLERLPYLEASQPFRSGFQYSNLMYIVAGAVMELVTGMSWEAMVRQWIFEPLGMAGSGFGDDTEGTDDTIIDYVGTPEAWIPADTGYDVKLCTTLNAADAGPCGSVVSMVEDLCKWLCVHLRSTPVPLLSSLALQEMHTAQIYCPNPIREPEVEDGGYAMGWFTQRYRGHRLVTHWGGGGGPTAASFMPDDGIGIVVHSNRSASPFHAINAVALSAYDRLLGLEAIPWHDRLREAMLMPYLPPAPDGDNRSCLTDGSLPGTYHHPGYGSICIEETDGNCVLRYGVLTFQLLREDAQTLVLTLTGNVPRILIDWWATRYAAVHIDADGLVTAVSIPFEPAVAPVLFGRTI